MMEVDDYIETLKRVDRSLEALLREQRRGSDCNPRTQLLEVADRSELALQANAERDGFALFNTGPGDVRWASRAQGASTVGMLIPADNRRARSVIVPNPAAGAEWIIVIPAGQRWRVQTIYAVFQASAAVGNRNPTLIVDDGTVNIYAAAPDGAIVANGAITMIAAPVRYFPTGGTALGLAAWPANLILEPGYRIRSSTIGLLAADQWSQIALLIEDLTIGNRLTNPYSDRGPHPYRGPVFVQASLPNTSIVVIEWTRASRAG